MSTLTPSLSALVLICAAFPTQLMRVASMTFDGLTAAARERVERVGLPVLAVAVAGLAWLVVPLPAPEWVGGSWLWPLIAVAAGALAPLWEIGIGYGQALLARRRVRHVMLHDRAPKPSVAAIGSVAVVAVCEELIFRWMGVGLLTDVFGWPLWAAIGSTALVYGLNHLYFGWLTVVQKTVTGAVYGVLYVLGGFVVLVPILAHVVHNVVVLTIVPRWGGRA